MVVVIFPARILVDRDFCEWLIKRKDKEAQFIKLTHIKSSSEHHKKCHNILPQEDADEIIKQGMIKEFNLYAAFKAIPMPQMISIALRDKIDQMIVWAIVLATDQPYKTAILTTKENEKKYIASSHYNSVKSIFIKSEEDAIQYIEILYSKFRTGRMLEH